MRREKLFSKDGYYSFLVQSNALLHREATDYGQRVVQQLLALRTAAEPVRILDLACGGEPITISAIMRAFPEQHFDYTGIDINPDQVELARHHFHYPENTVRVEIIEGSAWDLLESGVTGQYDIIFMGLNLHHGTPEEVYYLALQLNEFLKDKGVFINHDWYRPDDQLYRRRPDHHPQNEADSFLLVGRERLTTNTIPTVTEAEDNAEADPLWRCRYRKALRERLLANGGDTTGADSTYQHVALRDYPISITEFRKIFSQVGLRVRVLRYGERDPVEEYSAMPIATKSTELMAALQHMDEPEVTAD